MVSLRTMTEDDWPEVQAVYATGIAGGNASFESAPPPSWEAFADRHIPELCFVAFDEQGRVLGWASASRSSARAVYKGVAEVSVYVHEDVQGRGIGDALLGELVSLTEAAGIWTLQGSTFPENAASLRLQQRHGFRIVGTRERIAFMTYGPDAGRWRDTVWTERRSSVVN